jgi:hypothetical protein
LGHFIWSFTVKHVLRRGSKGARRAIWGGAKMALFGTPFSLAKDWAFSPVRGTLANDKKSQKRCFWEFLNSMSTFSKSVGV